MGTLSRYQGLNGVTPRQLKKATVARRALTGTRLTDVLAVVRHPRTVNRACRRLAWALWRQHCRATVVRYETLVLPNESPAMIQMRLLNRA